MNVKVIFRISSNNNTFLWKVFPPDDTGWKPLLQTNIPVPDWIAQADTILFLGYLLPKYAEACRCSSYQSRNNKRYKSNLVFQKRVSPNLTSALPPSVQPRSRQETAEVNRTTTSAEAIRLGIDSNDFSIRRICLFHSKGHSDSGRRYNRPYHTNGSNQSGR